MAKQKHAEFMPPALNLRIVRWNDNELIFFDDGKQESWIIYPPHSRYTFVKRMVAGVTTVEHRPWDANKKVDEHAITLQEGCTQHGMDCPAQAAIRAAIDVGFDPFT
jgi:hypothetical protein